MWRFACAIASFCISSQQTFNSLAVRKLICSSALLCGLLLFGCEKRQPDVSVTPAPADTSVIILPSLPDKIPDQHKPLTGEDITLTKELLFDKYALDDTYPYRDTVRCFKWETIRKCLAFIENMQRDSVRWAVLRNYKNRNGEAPLVERYVRNVYKRVADTLGVERYQSSPLYEPVDTVVPVRYGRDGALAMWNGKAGTFHRLTLVSTEGEWLVPDRYVRVLPDSVKFRHVAFVDRADQNIATLEWASEGCWLIRSTNPATTGMHRPPYAQETPLGMYVLQEKKRKMVYLKDGGSAEAGYAPYASRFTNGAYIHGVPVNLPQTAMIEYSASLGTTPRSHMCVRNATSHAKFVYDNFPTEASLVVVIE